MSKIRKKRYDYIDLLEFIAIFFVIIYHATNYAYNFIDGTNSAILYIRYFFRTILSTCVPLFFFANGFLLLNQEFNLKKHIVKSVRLVLISFIWGAIDIFLLSCIKNTPFSIKEYINAIWTWKYGWINHLWYMGALICIYVLFPLIKCVYDNQKKVFYYFIIITMIFTFGNKALNLISSIFTYIFWGRNELISINWFNNFNPYREIYGYAFVYFCTGGLIKNYINFISCKKKIINLFCVISLISSMLCLFVVGIIISRICGKMWDVVWNGYDTIFTFINVVSIFILTTNYNGNNQYIKRLIVLVSTNTLGIYLIHVVYIHALRLYVEKISFLCNILGNIIFAIIVLILSLITTILIKKIPLLKNIL